MKKLSTMFTLFIFPALFLQPAFAQYEPYTQMGLPEGAVARFSKGSIREITYSSDGTRVLLRLPLEFGFTMHGQEKNRTSLRGNL